MPATTPSAAAVNYEARLNQDRRWALTEGSRHFEEKSAVHETLRRISQRLNELNIPYAIVGGMALFHHGLRRFTEDVDLLVTREHLVEIHKRLCGLGYLPPFERSKHLRDTETGVRIEFLVAGDYPGDGKPKPVSFPDPNDVTNPDDELRFIGLATLVELKLASGLTATSRAKDLVDVQQLIETLVLPVDFADQLDPSVQPKFRELWNEVRRPSRRYVRVWPLSAGAGKVQSIEELLGALDDPPELLRQMQRAGIAVDSDSDFEEGYVRLVTSDPELARRFDMHDESEFWSDLP